MQEAFKSKSPVKLHGVKRMASKSFSGDDLSQYKILKSARIMPMSKEFEYNAELSSSLHTVKEALSADQHKAIDIKVKVMSKVEERQVILHKGKNLAKVDTLVADGTDTIKLVLWENIIDKVHAGKSYFFKNVKIRIYQDTKFLNTNESTQVEEIEDLQDVNLTSDKIKENLLEGCIVAVIIKKNASCIVCNSLIDNVTEDETITCKNCNVTTLTSTVNTKLVCQVVVNTHEGKMINYTCFNDAMQSFLNTISVTKDVSDMSIDELNKLFLKAGFKKMIVDDSTRIISQFLS